MHRCSAEAKARIVSAKEAVDAARRATAARETELGAAMRGWSANAARRRPLATRRRRRLAPFAS